MDTKEIKTKQLSGKQKRYLKGLGHHLSPLILIGKEGISQGLIEATILELRNRELIKVKIGTNSDVNKNDAVPALTTATGCELVQLIGKSLLLYKENPEKKKDERINLPKD